MSDYLRLHHILHRSCANGPGVRCVLWVQGCTLDCQGCFNPDTHPLNRGQEVHFDDLLGQMKLLGRSIEGITISGGEPLQQSVALLSFLKAIRQETALSVIVHTGYSLAEIQAKHEYARLLAYIDVLIAGRFIISQRIARSYIGSSNKTVHYLTDRYKSSDLESVPVSEVLITLNGDVMISGIDPLEW